MFDQAIEAIEDKIIYLNGKIILIKCDNETTKQRIIKSYKSEIYQLEKAIEILSNR